MVCSLVETQIFSGVDDGFSVCVRVCVVYVAKDQSARALGVGAATACVVRLRISPASLVCVCMRRVPFPVCRVTVSECSVPAGATADNVSSHVCFV